MRPQMVLFGDSITEQSFRSGGWGASLADTYSRKADVLVRGYGGYNTRWALFLLNHLFPLGTKMPPVATTVFFGANDAALLGRNGERQHVPVDEYKDNLRKIVRHLKASIHKFLETKKKNDTKEQKPENESDALTAEAVKRTPRKQLEHVFEIPLPEEPDTEDEAEIQKWKWKVNSVNQPVRWTTLLGFPVVQPYHHFGRHLPFRAIQEVVGPLQVRYFQHDFVPSNPKSKPKRYKYPEFYDPYGPRPHPSEKIVQLAEQIAALSPDERAQIGPTLRYKLKHPKLQLISTEGRDLGSQGGAAAAGGVAAKVEEKKEKMAFDVKLEKFEAAAKIKVIKEVRAFTNLGLKEAKDLVEKVPVLLKQGVTKEEANDIIEKIKTAGGVAVIE